MPQVTLRLSAQLAQDLKAAAAQRGTSVNRWVATVLQAAVDPEFGGDETERIRARLARAGLLADLPAREGPRGDREAVAHARREAGRGIPLSDLTVEGRG